LYDLNQVIFLLKKSFDLNRDLNQWFKSPWFKSANPGHIRHHSVISSLASSVSFARSDDFPFQHTSVSDESVFIIW